MKIIITFITNTKTYKANYDDEPYKFGYGSTPAEAVGNLVLTYWGSKNVDIEFENRELTKM